MKRKKHKLNPTVK